MSSNQIPLGISNMFNLGMPRPTAVLRAPARGLRRRIITRTNAKQTSEERAAKIAACKVKQYTKQVNRHRVYRRSLLNNLTLAPAKVASLIDLSD